MLRCLPLALWLKIIVYTLKYLQRLRQAPIVRYPLALVALYRWIVLSLVCNNALRPKMPPLWHLARTQFKLFLNFAELFGYWDVPRSKKLVLGMIAVSSIDHKGQVHVSRPCFTSERWPLVVHGFSCPAVGVLRLHCVIQLLQQLPCSRDLSYCMVFQQIQGRNSGGRLTQTSYRLTCNWPLAHLGQRCTMTSISMCEQRG